MKDMHRHEWNTESVWQCIRAKAPDRDDLCSAFNILHQVAYNTVFNSQDLFYDIKGTKDYINQLSFVGVTSVPGSKSQVRFTFSHLTFLEFFAALHLTTLPLNDQLAFIVTETNRYNFIPMYKSIIPDIMYYMKFYLGLIGDIFHYNTSGASPVLKQLFLCPNVEFFGICNSYKNVEDVIGWAAQQYGNAIDSILKANYSMCTCAYHSLLHQDEYYSELTLRGPGKLALQIESLIENVPDIVVTLTNCLTKQDQLHLLFCVLGLEHNQGNNCRGLRLPSVTSLTIYFYPSADILYKMKQALPNMEYLDIRLHRDWNQFNTKSLSKALKEHEIALVLTNLRMKVHLDINIE